MTTNNEMLVKWFNLNFAADSADLNGFAVYDETDQTWVVTNEAAAMTFVMCDE